MNKDGWFFDMIVSMDGVIITILSIFSIGLLWTNNVTTLMIGLWRFSIGFNLGYNSKKESQQHGIS